MEITIKNVGLISQSKIKMDGLTVITGSNNSGKSTVGKVVYSCISALENLEDKRNRDLSFYFDTLIREVKRIIKIDNILDYLDLDKMPEDELNIILSIFGEDNRYFLYVKDMIGVQRDIDDLIYGLNIYTVDFIEKYTKKTGNQLPEKYYAYLENLKISKEKAYKLIEKIKKYFVDSSLTEYAAASLLRILRDEFNNQIFPLKLNQKEKYSHVEISQNGEIGCEFTICNNEEIIHYDRILNKQYKAFERGIIVIAYK